MNEIRFTGTLVFHKEPEESKQEAEARLVRILNDLGIGWIPSDSEHPDYSK